METKTRKPENTTYLTCLSERIATERPSAQILYNTFLEIFETGFNKGYAKRLEDGTKFKRWSKDRQNASWDGVKTHISDMCSKQTVVNNNETE